MNTVTIVPHKKTIMIGPGKLRPALCLDLDGTVRYSKAGKFINKPEDIALFDGVEGKIREYRDKGYLIFGITNQGGVAFGIKTPMDIKAELDAMIALFENGNPFHIIKACYHHEDGKIEPYKHRSLLRKPGVGMLAICESDAFEAGYIVDWDNSIFVGDRPEDEQCATRAGIPFQWADMFFGNREPLGILRCARCHMYIGDFSLAGVSVVIGDYEYCSDHCAEPD
jgi:D-glycero-D-manno-heptose 1,7-bisphosphate phosphatase